MNNDDPTLLSYPEDSTSAVAPEPLASPVQQFIDVVTENPLPAALAAAAVGAGLMALAAMMVAPSRPSPSKVKAKVADDVGDQVKSLKSQLADLAQAVLSALPSKGEAQSKADDLSDQAASTYSSAKDALSDRLQTTGDTLKSAGTSAAKSASDTLKTATDSLRALVGDRWGDAGDALQKLKPQVDAVAQVARDNPMWAAVLAGAAGTLIGWQVLGSSRDD